MLKYHSRQVLYISLLAVIISMFLIAGCQPNTPPAARIKAEKDKVNLSMGDRITCVTSDADGDSLTLSWSATGGEFSGSGPAVTWFAPHKPGIFTVTANVSDGRGGEVSAETTIEVVNQLPVINGLTADPPLVIQGKTSKLGCSAYDPDGDVLQYEWKATGGTFSGEGPVVTWTAPENCSQYVVTVTVTDSTGGQQVREIGINVRKVGG